MGRVNGKTVLITAAGIQYPSHYSNIQVTPLLYDFNAYIGQGIGRASCLMLAREGATVIATDINTEVLDSLQNEADNNNLDIKTVKLDVTNKDNIQNVTSNIEKVDVLFNCAG